MLAHQAQRKFYFIFYFYMAKIIPIPFEFVQGSFPGRFLFLFLVEL